MRAKTRISDRVRVGPGGGRRECREGSHERRTEEDEFGRLFVHIINCYCYMATYYKVMRLITNLLF